MRIDIFDVDNQPMIRLYFNRRGAKPWSIDSGRGTTEIMLSEVSFAAGKCRYVFDPAAGDNENTPTAWIEIDDDAGFGMVP